ncbi:hypothetical protein BLSTO_03111 [Blastocystis sp. subtype 1]
MEAIGSDLRKALEVLFCNAPGNQNEAIQWIQEFQNSPQAINASLYVLKTSENNGAILFGVMKLLVQRILIGWSSLISFCVSV